MTDHWDGWPEDDPPDADTGDLGDPNLGDPGLGPHGLEPPLDADATAGFGAAGEDGDLDGDLDGDGPAPLGYGDEPLDYPEPDAHAEPDREPDSDPDSEPDREPDQNPGPEPPAESGAAAGDPPVGTDPDLDPYGDDPGGEPVFPEPLALGEPPEPVDGFPWTDAGLIGGAGVEPLADPAAVHGAPEPGDLFAYAGEDPTGLAGDGGWAALIASPDPATSALARFWSPAP
jgi:hypothetical protein